MPTTIQNKDWEELLESVNDELPVEPEQFDKAISELIELGYIIRNDNIDEDRTWYCGKPELQYSDISVFSDQLKQIILYQFIENPATFFVLFNTQKGKSGIIQDKLISWQKDPQKRVVTILMLDNDSTLSEQSTDGIVSRMKSEGVPLKVFRLVNSSKDSLADIQTYIDSYAVFPEYDMPLIAALTNPNQIDKIVKLLDRIQFRNERFPNLRYAIIWDEADKTYPLARDKPVKIGGKTMCIRNFTLDNTTALHGNGFVTATEGELMDGDYPECSSAHAVIPEINEEDAPHYRGAHLPGAIIKPIKIPRKLKNNDNFLDVFLENRSHFMEKTLLKNGQLGYRKTIINSNTSIADMGTLAREINRVDCHTIVFNQSGLTITNCITKDTTRFKTKKRYFNEVLFYAYKMCKLDSAPLFIIGRRKVDRGLGFHYAPRSHREIKTKTLDFGIGHLETDGVEGLIWTDMYLGRVEIKETASQKAGRLYGIVGQCPQCPEKLTWWTDINTANTIIHHSKIVDEANNQLGCMSMVQSLEHASKNVKRTTIIDISEVDYDWCSKGGGEDEEPYELFDTLEQLNHRKFYLNRRSQVQTFNRDSDGFYVCSVSAAAQRISIDTIMGFRKISSNLPKPHDKLFMHEITMRAYVYYDLGESDPEKCKYALRWIRRITHNPTAV